MTDNGLAFATGDDPVLCHLCGKDTSVAMIATHLVTEHGFDPYDIVNAPVVDYTDARGLGGSDDLGSELGSGLGH